AHAGDDGADVFVVEDEPQSHFGHGHAGGDEGFERVGVGHAALEIFGDEIGAAPVFGGPFAVRRQRARKAAFVEGDARDDRDILFVAGGEQFVFGILVEDIVDDLHGVEESGANGFDTVGGLPAI